MYGESDHPTLAHLEGQRPPLSSERPSSAPFVQEQSGGTLGGLVLAGGAGRRMGGPKARLMIQGRRLVDRAVDLVAPWCAAVVVVTRPEVPLGDLEAPSDLAGGLAVVEDRPGWDGPLGALATGLGALDTQEVLVLACDLPMAGPAVTALVEAGAPGATDGPTGWALVTVDAAGRRQGLCARYQRVPVLGVAHALLERGERRLGALLDEVGPELLATGGPELTNLNTPEDLAACSPAEWTP